MRAHNAALFATVTLVVVLVWSLLAGLGREPTVAHGGGAEPALERRGRVEVLNAAGRPGLARAGTWVLRERGFDVVAFGNARSFGRDSSVVLSRTADVAIAHDVAAALGIAAVRAEPDSTLFVDVTVLLGADWTSAAVPLPWRN